MTKPKPAAHVTDKRTVPNARCSAIAGRRESLDTEQAR
jgi:hypothetical protein